MSTAIQSTFSFVYDVVTSGLGGIAVVGFWQRWIVPGSAYTDMKTERDEWKNLYEKEREAHQATRDALIMASRRGDTGVEAARIVIDAFQAGRRQGDER